MSGFSAFSVPLLALAETSPKGPCSLVNSGHPAGVPLRFNTDSRPDLHGAHGQEETPVRGGLQSQHTGGGRGSPRNGQHAQSSPGGTLDMTKGVLLIS